MKSARCADRAGEAARMHADGTENGVEGFYKSAWSSSRPESKRPVPDLDALRPLFARLQPGVAPNWTTRYRVGAILSRHLDTCCTLEVLGAELGITKQNAYTESVVALGTLVCALYLRMHFPRPRNH